MQAHSYHSVPQTEHGMDGWYVWGPKTNLLFYSKHPVFRIPADRGQQQAPGGHQQQEIEINIAHAGRDSWTDLMQHAHAEVLPFFSLALLSC